MSEAGISHPNEPHAGSPLRGEPAFLVVGKLRRPHGVRGEILMQVITDFPERLTSGVLVYAGEAHTPLRIRSARPHAQGLLLAFEGYDSPEAIGAWRNALLFVPTADRPPLPDGEYYHHQLLGLKVVDQAHRPLGFLKEILLTPANDVYVVQAPDGSELLIPAVEAFISKIDLTEEIIQVQVIPGLLSD